MRIGTDFILALLLVTFFMGCKKEASAPSIDSIVGIYKVSGSMHVSPGYSLTLNDSLVAITKINDQTIQFISSGCDSSFVSIWLVYTYTTDTSIQFLYTLGMGPYEANISFATVPNVSFAYSDGFYCQGNIVNSSLTGTKVQ